MLPKDADHDYAKGLAKATLEAINSLQYEAAHDLLTHGTAFYPPWADKGPPSFLGEALAELCMVRLAADKPESFTSPATAGRVWQESLTNATKLLFAASRLRRKPRKAQRIRD